MAKKLDPAKELTTWEDIAYSNMVQNEAACGKTVGDGKIKWKVCEGMTVHDPCDPCDFLSLKTRSKYA